MSERDGGNNEAEYQPGFGTSVHRPMPSATQHALEPFIAKAKSPEDIARLMLELYERNDSARFGMVPASEIMELTHRLRGNAWATAASSMFNEEFTRLQAERNGTAPKQPAPHLHGAPVDIHYMGNDDDVVTSVVRAMTFGEVIGGSIHEMVDVILERAKERPIRKLTISAHGTPGQQGVGGTNSGLTADIKTADRDHLRRLRGHFAPDAIVVLQGCNVGGGPQGEALLLTLSELWGGVAVRAGTPIQRPFFPGMEGSTTTVDRDAKGNMRTERYDNPRDELAQTGPFGAAGEALDLLRGRSDEDVAGLGLEKRYELARALMTTSNLKELFTGSTSAEEAKQVMRLFRTASPQGRRELYLYLENHPWTGKFQHGALEDDDMLWNALSNPQLAELEHLLGSP